MTTPVSSPPAARAASRAVMVVFAANGFGIASWAARIPSVRDGLGFSESQMGLLLLTAAIGAIVALPLSGVISSRLGAARTVVVFAVACAAGFSVACLGVTAGSPQLVRFGLFIAGAGIGVWDAAMNLEGAVVEQRLGRSIMPRFHAGYSLGTVAGAGLGIVAAYALVPLTWHVISVVAFNVVAVASFVRAFLPTKGLTPGRPTTDTAPDTTVDPAAAVEPPHGQSLRDTLATWQEPRTLLIGVLILAAALTEGAANDWVSLAVVDGFGAHESMGALALALFLAAMTGTRLLGTRLIDRFGRVAVLRVSGGAALFGVLVFTTAPIVWVALIGVAMWGVGSALGFPMGMSAASDETHRAATRVSVVSTIGYSAFFVGPALIGFLAEQTGYRNALLVLAIPVAAMVLVAGVTRKPADH